MDQILLYLVRQGKAEKARFLSIEPRIFVKPTTVLSVVSRAPLHPFQKLSTEVHRRGTGSKATSRGIALSSPFLSPVLVSFRVQT